MAVKHEQLEPKVLELRFKPEGYVSTGDAEFLDQFLAMLAAQGLDPASLVYRGFDGTQVDAAGSLPEDPIVYAMNGNGWNEAIRQRTSTPADYAVGEEVPCLAVYDKTQLAEAYSATHLNPQEDDMSTAPIMLGDIKKGDDLSTMEADRVVNEEVVHKNFPEGTPTDALVALVYLDD